MIAQVFDSLVSIAIGGTLLHFAGDMIAQVFDSLVAIAIGGTLPHFASDIITQVFDSLVSIAIGGASVHELDESRFLPDFSTADRPRLAQHIAVFVEW